MSRVVASDIDEQTMHAPTDETREPLNSDDDDGTFWDEEKSVPQIKPNLSIRPDNRNASTLTRNVTVRNFWKKVDASTQTKESPTMNQSSKNNKENLKRAAPDDWIDMKKNTVLANGCTVSLVLSWCCRESLQVKDGVLTTKWCSDCQKRTLWSKYPPGGPYKKSNSV